MPSTTPSLDPDRHTGFQLPATESVSHRIHPPAGARTASPTRRFPPRTAGRGPGPPLRQRPDRDPPTPPHPTHPSRPGAAARGRLTQAQSPPRPARQPSPSPAPPSVSRPCAYPGSAHPAGLGGGRQSRGSRRRSRAGAARPPLPPSSQPQGRDGAAAPAAHPAPPLSNVVPELRARGLRC